jgi:RNA polymerase sigma-70 factor (ECF subfamily)
MTRYMPALRAHVVFRFRVAADRAEDYLQAFLADKVLEHALIGHADRARGKFRSFLMTALNNFVLNSLRNERAGIRSPEALVSLHQKEGLIEPVGDDPSPSEAFDLAWAREVIDQTIQRMKAECASSGRDDLWGLFEGRTLEPALRGAEPIAYGELISRFGLSSPAQATNLLVTANRMFVRHLRAVISRYELEEDEIDAEIDGLWQVLARGRASS